MVAKSRHARAIDYAVVAAHEAVMIFLKPQNHLRRYESTVLIRPKPTIAVCGASHW